MAKNSKICGGLYTEKVMETFKNPHNYGRMKNPDGIGKIGNPTCGDIMWVYIKIGRDKKGNDILKNIKFKTFGCAAAIATSSMVTKLAKGKKLREVEKINYREIVKSLGGLPNIKIHCSTMATQALNLAIADYKKKKKKKK